MQSLPVKAEESKSILADLKAAPKLVRVSIRFDNDPPKAILVSTDPNDCKNNIHKFIEDICAKIEKPYQKALILLLEPDCIIFDVKTIEEGDRLLIIPRNKLNEIMRIEEEK